VHLELLGRGDDPVAVGGDDQVEAVLGEGAGQL
jgi:hypothetical protein